MSRALVTRLVLLVAVSRVVSGSSCSSTPPNAFGEFAGPSAVVAATKVVGTTASDIIVIANGDAGTLRLFDPATRLFVRGPNAVSPLSVELAFRPERLAAGTITSPAGQLGFVVVGGASTRLALLDTQTNALAVGAGDAVLCGAGSPAPSCLPASVIDVAAAKATVVALTGAGPAGKQLLAVLSPTVEEGAPVLALSRTLLLEGRFSGVALSADGTKAFVADDETPRILEVSLGADSTRDLVTAGPVDDVYVVPAYDEGRRPAGEFLLARLVNGTLQTIDPVAGAPAKDPIDETKPMAPLSLGTPIRDVTFVPCRSEGVCRSRVELSGSESVDAPLLAFAALGDGTSAALVPDAAKPWVFRPIDRDGNVAAASGSGVTIDAGSVTDGVTKGDVIVATPGGVMPLLFRRLGQLEFGTEESTLSASGVSFDGAQVGDVIGIRIIRESCGFLQVARSYTVTGATADGLTLKVDPPPAGACSGVRVEFTVAAGPLLPWVVAGSNSGYLGRYDSGATVKIEGRRFYYPDGAKAGPAVSFTLPTATTGGPVSVSLTSGLVPFLLPATSYGGLASGVAAIPNRLYVATVGGNRVIEIELDNTVAAAGTKIYQ